MKSILVNSILGNELRSRSSVQKITPYLINDTEFILDMTDVSFMSRSFADELCELVEKSNIRVLNMASFVADMFKIVNAGRNKQRVRNDDDSEIVDCTDINSLSALF